MAMICATSAQLLEYVVNATHCLEMKLIPHKRWGVKPVDALRGPISNPNSLVLGVCMKVKSKEGNQCQKINNRGKEWNKQKGLWAKHQKKISKVNWTFFIFRSTSAWRISLFNSSYKKDKEKGTYPMRTPKILIPSNMQQKSNGGVKP